jgi:hypothetical protein
LQICAESVEDYKTRFRRRLLELRDKLAALPSGVATRLAIACVRSATTQSPEAFRKVHAKVQDDFHRTDRVLRLDAGIENMQSTRGGRDWDTLKQVVLLRFSEAFEQRMEAYGEEVRTRAGVPRGIERPQRRPAQRCRDMCACMSAPPGSVAPGWRYRGGIHRGSRARVGAHCACLCACMQQRL